MDCSSCHRSYDYRGALKQEVIRKHFSHLCITCWTIRRYGVCHCGYPKLPGSRFCDRHRPRSVRDSTFRYNAILYNLNTVQFSNNQCAKCRKDLNGIFDADHIVPLSKGGTNDPANSQILCPHCNRTKYNNESVDYRIFI